MVRVVFTSPDGARRTIDAPAGTTLMEAARDNAVAGIVAECGGACSCATCHVHVGEAWLDRLPAMKPTEADMLEFADGVDPLLSRLSCQIILDDRLDGLAVSVPELR